MWEFFKGTIFLLAFLLFFVLVDSALASNSIIINEFLYNPDGTDSGNEWIELYNPTDSPIDLAGWSVQTAGSSFGEVVEIAEGEITDFFLICEMSVVADCDMRVSRIGMQNGGTSSDGVRILDEQDLVVDTVIYDLPNTNNLVDESGVIVLEDNTSPTVSSGESLGRLTPIDTDNNRIDFTPLSPTPGESNYVEEDGDGGEDNGDGEDGGSQNKDDLLADTGYNHFQVTFFVITLLFIIYKYSDMLFQQ